MKIATRLYNYIGGVWTDAVSKKTFQRENPAHPNVIIATAPASDQKDISRAVSAARKAFPMWRAIPAPKRGEMLFRVANLLLEHKHTLGDLVTREMGKVTKEGHGDVQEAIDMGFYMAAEGRRLWGQTVPSELPNKAIQTIRQPVGVFALITPWNFPTAIPAWKIFPALVSGNTVVFKPSSYTSSCAYHVVKLFEEAGIPPGVLNLVHGSGSQAGDALVNHPDIDGVSFTGSSVIGQKIGAVCGAKMMKHCLELGGKNVVVIMPSANLELASEGCLWAAFGTTGQRCTAASRILVHKTVYKKFRDLFIAQVKTLRLGDGLKSTTDMGPLVNTNAVEKTKQYVEIGKKHDNAKLLIGGHVATDTKLDHGYFFEPTVFEEVTPNMRIFCEEIFGPVVGLASFNNFEEGLKFANAVDYGLSSSIYTQDVNEAHRFARDSETGLVYVNTSTIGAEIQVPFGGIKHTGNGHREAGGLGGALETYTEMKTINFDYSGKLQKAQIEE